MNLQLNTFLRTLQKTEADAARAKIKQRWGEQYPQEQGIGYALPYWSAFADAAIKAGYSADLLVECGLIRKREGEGNGY